MALPAAVTAKRVTVTTVVLCGILVVLSLVIIVPLALSSKEAGGRCLLYANRGDFGPSSVCSYIHSVAAVFQLMCCLVRAVLTAVVLAGLIKKEAFVRVLSSKPVLMVYGIVDVTACVLTLVSGGLLSHGFTAMCSKIFYPHSDKCGTMEFYSLSTSTFVKNYYKRLEIAQASVWISWMVWILLVLADLVLLWKADVLSDLRGLSCWRSGAGEGDTNTNSSRIRRDKDSNQSQRSGVFLLFRSGGGDSDTDSGPRTPPPRRPVPPRPPAAAAGAAAASVGRPLMDNKLRGERC